MATFIYRPQRSLFNTSSKSRPDLPHSADIVFPLKKADNDVNKYDDMWKVVWSMHQIMRSDPFHRFALGITIENTTLRFRISHRAYLVASTPIDINSKPVDLVRIFLGIALSPADRLGYDPTMARVESGDGDGKYCYDITVHDRSGKERIFRTKDEISTYGADADVDPEGKRLYALKDTWVNADRTREGDTLKILRERLIERKEIDGLNHLLTEVASGDVDVRNRADNTGASIQNGRLFTVDSIVKTCSGSDGVGRIEEMPARGSKQSASSVDNVPNIDPPPAEGGLRIGQVLEEHRVHYRIVFEEIGTPIHQLRTFSEIFVALRDAVFARGLLVDLEYAKDVPIKSRPYEFRTGTRDFMALEVRESTYLFGRDAEMEPEEFRELPPFQHNCLHDVESIWWIALWTSYVFAPTVPSQSDVAHFYRIFPPLHVQAPRITLGPSILQSGAVLKMRPEQNRPVFDAIWRWRFHLLNAYKNLEQNRVDVGQLDESTFEYVHDEALHHLNALLATLGKDDLGTSQLVHMRFFKPGRG
ncbi:hypothetical protein BS47DRAFT_1481235 [Hydnum rufescens UP504]|uniref:Fungal-type protein kinase domain-containing protein n=1 Tax=Hydnum rufescens UP504 TaxID=1448309 RepID=A0A9P6BBA7_9AGAM|nr:hypothetical protein BS47DRAFT_1481235 [Hydnum rufescens UP504]